MRNKLLPALVFVLPILLALKPQVIDTDLWWHMSVGKWVSDHRTVPVFDPFSQRTDKPWVAYSWLYEVLLYQIYAPFGLTGIVAYRLAMSLAMVWAVYALLRDREQPFTFVVAGLAAIAMGGLFTPRPWQFTIVFAAVTLKVILDLRDGCAGRGVWLLPLLYAVWANLHIQFIYGLFWLGLACLPYRDWQCSLVKRYALLALCALATLVNPYHVRLYGVVLEYAGQSYHYTTELQAMSFRSPPDWVAVALGAWALFTLARRVKVSLFELLLLGSGGFFALRANRDVWFLTLAAVGILAGATVIRPKTDWLSRAAPLALTACLIAFLFWQRDISEANLRRSVAKVFPTEAVAYLARNPAPGPLFNDFDWGGYLIWSLPQLPVLVDGRTNLHGDERIVRLMKVWDCMPGWREDGDLKSAGTVIANIGSPLAYALLYDKRFRLVYEDSVARVFVSQSETSRQRCRTCSGVAEPVVPSCWIVIEATRLPKAAAASTPAPPAIAQTMAALVLSPAPTMSIGPATG